MRLLILVLILFVCGFTQITIRQGTDTLKLHCSVNNADSLQWYRSGSVLSGETDSVLTVLADSAAYKNKYVFKCRTANSIDTLWYGDWTLGMSGNKRVFYFKRKY